MGKRKTRRTRKRGGATIPDYARNLEERKKMFRELIDLIETELNGKQYITESLENQLLDAIVNYQARFRQFAVPAEIRTADPEYVELFRHYNEVGKRLVDIPVRGG